MTIGNALDAATVLDFFKATRGIADAANDEIRWLGDGCYRSTYLHIASSVVYKITRRDNEEDMGNAGEYAVATRVSSMDWSDKIRIPKVNLHHIIGAPVRQPILSMEWIEGTIASALIGDPYAHPGREEFVRRSKVGDMHADNFLISSDNRFVPIDMGCNW